MTIERDTFAEVPVRDERSTATRSLRAALHYFSATLQSQQGLLDARRRELAAIGDKLEEVTDTLAHRQAEIEGLRQTLAQREAEIDRLAQALARPSRLRLVLRHPVRAVRYVLRRIVQRLRPVAPPQAAVLPQPTPALGWMSTPVPARVQPSDYRDRMRALLDEGPFRGLRTLTLVVPPAMRQAGVAIESGLAETGLACTVAFAMPAQFTDALYLVVNPCAFARLPPAGRRIVWLVEPAEQTATLSEAVLAPLAESLAIFDASLTHIAALQARGIALYQTFYVPLDLATAPDALLADDSPMGLAHLLPRALHGCGAIDDEAFERATRGTRLDADHLVLCLPESLARFESARAHLRPGAALFPGLRQLDGWKGTALSYRFMARRALAAGRTRLIVSEDDAELGEGFEARLAKTLEHLDLHAGRWDLFSGLLTDLSERAEVKAVEASGSDLFLRLDSVIGMVFGIYGPPALAALATYRVAGNDTMKDTIDRYLEALRLRCVTIFPPLVWHGEDFASTLWMPEGWRFSSNESMNPMIHRSQLRLVAKIGECLERDQTPR
ncbi:hypothetical protein [Variovorax boronicumulans]|uniref:hypothetical protein n=1 Tax=Variovorax boronicumulans TaxID=436515 RepID=UPI001C59BE94